MSPAILGKCMGDAGDNARRRSDELCLPRDAEYVGRRVNFLVNHYRKPVEARQFLELTAQPRRLASGRDGQSAGLKVSSCQMGRRSRSRLRAVMLFLILGKRQARSIVTVTTSVYFDALTRRKVLGLQHHRFSLVAENVLQFCLAPLVNPRCLLKDTQPLRFIYISSSCLISNMFTFRICITLGP